MKILFIPGGNFVEMGRLYNFPALEDTRQLAPTGYRAATLQDVVELIEYLGGETVAGGHIKQAGTDNWEAPNTGADNSSGLKALPAGTRSELGTFADRFFNTTFWIDNR